MTTQYREGRYSEALASCQELLRSSPNSAALRYWRANILVSLHNFGEAKLDYLFVMGNTTDPTLRGYCQTALESLATAVHSQGNAQVRPSVDRITRQADADSNGILMDGTTRQNYFHNIGAQLAGAAGDMRTINAMQSATYKVGNTYVPRYTPEEIQFQRNQLIDKANQLQTENDIRATEALQVAQQKAFETEAAAANLAAQINSGSKKGFHLNEEGTNLYVRQYNALPSTSSYTPNPATVTINDSADAQRGRFESPMQATARALDPALQKQLDQESRKSVKSNVFGRITPPDQSASHH